MKEYFFLKGKDSCGPFTVEQLADKGLISETLIWTEGIENWQKLSNISELAEVVKLKSVPPPPPIDDLDSTSLLAQELKDIPQHTSVLPTEKHRKILTWLIIWCGFHLFALLMTHTEDIFDGRGVKYGYTRSSYLDRDGGTFWPIVDFYETCYKREDMGYDLNDTEPSYIEHFNGIFVQYDWTEFAFYVGGAIFMYLLFRVSNKK